MKNWTIALSDDGGTEHRIRLMSPKGYCFKAEFMDIEIDEVSHPSPEYLETLKEAQELIGEGIS